MDKNKTIAKNTIVLYARMVLFLIISLFTARIVFNALGVDNYGIYNLVGGIIVLFSFLNNALGTATSRYVTTEISVGTVDSTRKVFNICLQTHILIALIILVLAETVGLWGVNNILNIPEDRLYAANWVYQLSVFSALIGVIQSPYNSTIVAYEKMSIYAYFSIIDVVAKLLVIILIQYMDGDKLILYAIMMFFSSFLYASVTWLYCVRKFPICSLIKYRNGQIFKEIFQFTSWSLLGQLAVVGTNQGVNILINIFFTVAINAAMGIANQITSIVNGFITNFQIAFRPPIMKSYAAKEYDDLFLLVMRTSKMSSYLILIFAVPIIIETHNVLTLWLGNDVPQYSELFCQFSLGYMYFEAIAAPLWMVIYSDKVIKKYQLITSSIYSLNFLLSYLFLLLGFFPPIVIVIRCFVSLCLVFSRLSYSVKLLPTLKKKFWIYQVLIKGVVIYILASILPYFIYCNLNVSKILNVIIVSMFSLFATLPLMYFWGFDKHERMYCNDIVEKIINKYVLRR